MGYLEEKSNNTYDVLTDECITITGMHHYCTEEIIDRGFILRCEKEPDNEKDHEAIFCALPVIKKIGYVANNTFTVLNGTQSAGRIYDKVGDIFYVEVLMKINGKAIAKVLHDDEKKLEKRWRDNFFNTKK